MAGSSGSQQMILIDELLKLLECPVCMNQMAAPIEICVRGHSICTDCRGNVQLCPACRGEFNGGRNYLAEDLSNKCLQPCENVDAGCTRRLTKTEMESHGRCCPYRLYKCLAGANDSCQWTGRRTELLGHVKAEHRGYVVTTIPGRFSWRSNSFEHARYTGFLLYVHCEIFWYFHSTNPSTRSAFQCVQFLGREERASEFCYSLQYQSRDGYRKLHFTDITKSDLQDLETIIESRECMEVGHGVANYFIDSNNKIFYCLNVLKKESL